MRRLLVRLGVVAAALTVAMATPATAQVEIPIPSVPLPALPSQAEPVLEVLGPIATPQCATATVVGVLLPALVGPSLPALPVAINTFAVFAPVYTICGQLPPPGERVRLVCAVDDQVAALATLAGEQSIGTALPIDTRVVGPAVEIVSVIQDKLPAQAKANTPDLAKTASEALACRVFGAGPPVPSAEPTPGTDQDAEAFDIPVAANTGNPLELSDFLDVLDQAEEGTSPPAVISPEPVTRVIDGRFHYPVIFVLPLLLLAIGAYVGRVVTKPIR